MSTEPTHEIVIVRRRGNDDHDDHHGGVWKVAFADFMTAMMAFFLVLWIVNSTTKQTRSSLARYFNPIRLSDTTPARKGLNDPREVDFDASSKGSSQAEPSTPALPPSQSSGHQDKRPSEREERSGPMTDALPSAGSSQEFGGSIAFPGMKAKPPNQTVKDSPKVVQSSESQAMKAAIDAAIGDEGGAKLKEAVSVVQVGEGLLISLTDTADMGSFSLGSSEPEDKLVRVLSAIAGILAQRPGNVVVRGHTDARPYKGGRSDNWRLSFARAQAAFVGLVRGGLDEKRIERVEGYADRKPRDTHNPNSSENRRIEILLRKSAS